MKILFNKTSCKTKSALVLCAALFTTFSLSSCAALFQKKVPLDNSSNKGSLSNLLIPKFEITTLDSPKQIFVSQAEFNDSIKISWSKVEGAAFYRLERALATKTDKNGNFIIPDESEFSPVGTGKVYNTTTFNDIILTNPTYTDEEYENHYFYRVCAENPRLKYETSEFTVSEPAFLLAPPKAVEASLGEFTDQIIINWQKTTGAKNYTIYRSNSADGSSSVKIGYVAGNVTKYTTPIGINDQGKDFYFSVVATNGDRASISSSVALGYALQAGAPPKVSNVRIEKGRGDSTDSIKITWDAANGEDIHYAVYRSSSKDSSLTLLNGNLLGTTSFTDTKALRPNVLYYYQVQAYKIENEEKIKGPFSDSNVASKNPAEGYILSPPAFVSVEKNQDNSGTCTIYFSPALGSKDCTVPMYANLPDNEKFNTYSYEILASNAQDSSFNSLKTVEKPLLDDNNNYIVPEVAGYKFYKIVTIHGDAKSAESSLCAPVPFAARNLTVTRGKYIEGVTTSDEFANPLGIHAVKISWEPSLANDADGGYDIYRSAKPDSGFKKINESPILSTFYIDYNDTAKAATYYYYKVMSLNILNQGSNYSESQWGYGALTAEQYMREYNKTVINSQKKLTLMHKSPDTAKLGSEEIKGGLSGTLKYDASMAGLGARIKMHYQDYADYYTNNDSSQGFYFLITGDTNTTASMDASGTMDGTVNCTGMYNGAVVYDKIQIKGGGAGGGTYGIKREGFPEQVEISWKIGEEGK